MVTKSVNKRSNYMNKLFNYFKAFSIFYIVTCIIFSVIVLTFIGVIGYFVLSNFISAFV